MTSPANREVVKDGVINGRFARVVKVGERGFAAEFYWREPAGDRAVFSSFPHATIEEAWASLERTAAG